MRLMSLFAAALLIVGCHSPSSPSLPTPTPPSTIPGAPATLHVLASSRTDQQLDVSAVLTDAKGLAIPDVDVQFTITGGTVTPTIVKTDASGTAKAIAIASGTQTLSATIGILTSTATVIGGATPLSVTLFAGTVIVGTATPFSANVSGSALGGPFAYVWTYGDGVTESGSSPSVTHTYAKSDRYNASVKVTDGAGRSASAAASAVVNDPPAPAPAPPPPAAPTLQVTMTCTGAPHATPTPCNVNAAYGSANLASQAITRVDWDWGDGTAIQTVNNSPLGSHTYAQAGAYNITATVTATTTDGAKTASASKAITVN